MEMTAHALSDWCGHSRTWTVYLKPGSPWHNPHVERFHSRTTVAGFRSTQMNNG